MSLQAFCPACQPWLCSEHVSSLQKLMSASQSPVRMVAPARTSWAPLPVPVPRASWGPCVKKVGMLLSRDCHLGSGTWSAPVPRQVLGVCHRVGTQSRPLLRVQT